MASALATALCFFGAERYAQISVFHRIFECRDCRSVGTPKKQCAVIAWQAKTACAVASGTKQNTGAFCFSAKNWVLFCGDSN
nr:hypothetical protein [Zobellia laminariae]